MCVCACAFVCACVCVCASVCRCVYLVCEGLAPLCGLCGLCVSYARHSESLVCLERERLVFFFHSYASVLLCCLCVTRVSVSYDSCVRVWRRVCECMEVCISWVWVPCCVAWLVCLVSVCFVCLKCVSSMSECVFCMCLSVCLVFFKCECLEVCMSRAWVSCCVSRMSRVWVSQVCAIVWRCVCLKCECFV